MADSLYAPDPIAQDTLVQPWDEAFRVRTFRCLFGLPRSCTLWWHVFGCVTLFRGLHGWLYNVIQSVGSPQAFCTG
jgi:hypothetical protein